MRSLSFVALVVLLGTSVSPCHGQFVRPPVVVRPPVPVVHPPLVHMPGTHGPQGANQAGNAFDSDLLWWCIGGVVGLVALGGGGFVVYRWYKRSGPRAVIRIVAVPPGEAPEFVRRAWVGLELPVIAGQVHAAHGVALGVLTQQSVDAPASYAVDGKTAIAILQSAAPEIAAWWRQNAPAAVARGYQLIFPAEVCERLDDLGT
jgi:hypothetical protein